MRVLRIETHRLLPIDWKSAGSREVPDVVGEADELFVRPLEALGEHETERQRERGDQVEPDDADEEAHEPIVAARLGPDDRGGLIRARDRGVSD